MRGGVKERDGMSYQETSNEGSDLGRLSIGAAVSSRNEGYTYTKAEERYAGETRKHKSTTATRSAI